MAKKKSGKSNGKSGMDKGHVAAGFLSGIFSNEIVKTVVSSLTGVAGEALKNRLQIQKGGKGIEDEIIFCEVTLSQGKGKLAPTQKESLDAFLKELHAKDKELKTKKLAAFTLFIAKGAEIFASETEYPNGEGKNKKAIKREERVTKRGIDFIKELLKRESYEEKIEFCECRRVFTAYDELVSTKMSKMLGTEGTINKTADSIAKILKTEFLQKIPKVENPGFFKGVFGFSFPKMNFRKNK